jgi:acetoin utilization protein AcuB
MTNVKDVMNHWVMTIGSSDSCLEAVARMHRARVRHLPVVDREGRLLGIITDRDLSHHLFSPAVFPALGMTPLDTLLKAASVADLMTTDVVTVRPSDTLGQAARLMSEQKVGSLPVLEDGRLVGILTETDMLRLIVRSDVCAPECAEAIVSFP